MKKIIFTTLVLGLYLILYTMYDQSRGVIEGQVAVNQLKDSDEAYVSSNLIINGAIIITMTIATVVLLILTWSKSIMNIIGRTNSKSNMLIVGSLIALFSSGCKPYMSEKFVDIQSNETAYVVPLEGATKSNQGKFDSVEFLEEKKIAAKRITIPRRYRSTGRMYFSAEIIDVVRVITVDRSPVSRRWTDINEIQPQFKVNPSTECIWVESRDSIGFGLGVTITAAVEESNTSLFLYRFPTGKNLSSIIDQEVKAFVQQVLAREFGQLDLKECKIAKADIFSKARSEATVFFHDTYGITITTLGHSGGLTYENKEIQDAINDNYVAEMSIEKRENEALAQKFENDRLLSIEVNGRERAEEFNKAIDAQTAKIELEIRRMQAEAQLEMAKKWSGALPSQILPANSPLLLGLGQNK